MTSRLLKLSPFLLLIGMLHGQNTLQNQIDDLLKNDFYKHANIGLSVRNIKSNEILVNVNKDKLMIPGSTLKIITTFTAYEILGENFRFETKLSHDGYVDSDGILKGNLYIEGSGDPTLGSERIDGNPGLKVFIKKIISAIKSKGITCVEGEIISINPLINVAPIEDTWQWHDLGNYYATGTWPINIHENLYNIYYNRSFPEGQKAKISYIEPFIPNLQLTSDVTVANPESPDNAYIFGPAFEYQKKITGTIPKGKGLYKVKGAIPDPPLFLAFLVYQALGQEGISVSHYKTMEKKPTPTILMYTHTSPPLTDIIKFTNFNSINLYADALLQALKPNTDIFANTTILKEKLFQTGADTIAMDIKDGSGLSARNLITADQMSGFISFHARHKSAETIQRMLPAVGKEGTVKNLFKNAVMRGKMWLKSGSMHRILCYSGIAKGKSGNLYALSIFLNGSIATETKINLGEMEKILQLIYEKS